jgi:hypothetical protein
MAMAPQLANVGVIKTSGGLFNFLSGSRVRAPLWMQRVGLEWGLADMAGATPIVLALFHHQSPRALPAVQQDPQHRCDAIESRVTVGANGRALSSCRLDCTS